MSSPMQVDVDDLRAVSSRLGAVADRIDGLRVEAAPQLGELRTARAVDDATRVVLSAYRALGARVRSMSDIAAGTAAGYAETEQSTAERLHRNVFGD